jgi:hypothetical protein
VRSGGSSLARESLGNQLLGASHTSGVQLDQLPDSLVDLIYRCGMLARAQIEPTACMWIDTWMHGFECCLHVRRMAWRECLPLQRPPSPRTCARRCKALSGLCLRTLRLALHMHIAHAMQALSQSSHMLSSSSEAREVGG